MVSITMHDINEVGSDRLELSDKSVFYVLRVKELNGNDLSLFFRENKLGVLRAMREELGAIEKSLEELKINQVE